LLVTIALVGGIWWAIYHQWSGVQEHRLEAHPKWGYVAVSGVVFLATYAVLIATWRGMLSAWNAQLPFWDAARIWCVSNLGRYVPGKVWQIIAMGKMAADRQVSPVAAAGSAILSTVVNIACGMAVAMVTGWQALEAASRGNAEVGAIIIAAVVLGITALPFVTTPITRLVSRVSGREISLGPPPMRAVLIAIVGNMLSWIMYGLAFRLLVVGVVGDASGSFASYVAAYSSSYVLGYLALVLPGGLGARDGALVVVLVALGLTTHAQALLVAVASRLWLTILEIGPGLIFWLMLRRATPTSQHLANGST
jgi:glycosyltransferase 2 family protein